MPENENFITRINYDPRAKHAFLAFVCASTALAIRAAVEPSSLSHLLFMPSFASVREAVINDNDAASDIHVGLVGSGLWEGAQMLFPTLGQAQIEDFAVSAVGGLLLLPALDQLDTLAKNLHDSSLTDPIYEALGITKRT